MAILDDTPTGPHFDPNEFAEAIRTHGHRARIRPRRACPCGDPVTGQPRQDCGSCDNGNLWGDGDEDFVLAPGRKRGDIYDPIGLYMNGMLMLTFRPERTPGHLDRVDLLDAEMIVTQERHAVGDGKERARHRPVLRIEAVDWWNGSAAVSLDPAVLTVDGDGWFTWIESPPPGAPYTLRYATRPAYVVMSPQSRDEGGTKQPYRALCQRLDFFQSAGA